MNFGILGRVAGIVVLTAGLAGCIDMTMDITVTSDTTAKTTVTQTMGADIYAMIKASEAQSGDAAASDAESFCKEEGSSLTENADGSATCVIASEGAFADLKFDDDNSKPTFTLVSPGVVRIAIPTKDFSGSLGTDDADEQTKAMMKQFFEGHALTIRLGGKQVTETNMTLSADKTSAEIVIPFLDLMNGTVKLPEELFAVVKTN